MRAVRAVSRGGSSDAAFRRKKVESMRDAEEQRQHREKLRSILMQKLGKKYLGASARRIVGSAVESVVERTTTLNAPDLAALESSIVSQIQQQALKEAKRPQHQESKTREPPHDIVIEKQPNTASLLSKTSEWKILDAYQIIQNEEMAQKAVKDVKKKQLDFKLSLDEQMRLKVLKSTGAQLKKDDDDFAANQVRLLLDWRSEMTKTKKQVADRHLEERRVRDKQVEHRRCEKKREDSARRSRENKDLADCRAAIETHRRNGLEKKEAERLRLLKIMSETDRDKCLKEERKREEGLEDQRMMLEYKEKLKREEEQRANAFAKRAAKLEEFALKSSTSGAVFNQRETIRKQEMLVLVEAQKKERADSERELYDLKQKRSKAMAMAKDNKRLVTEKQQREATFDGEERCFAERYVRESDDFLRDEASRFTLKRETMKKHSDLLARQISIHKANAEDVEMDDRERSMNRGLLDTALQSAARLEKHLLTASSPKNVKGSRSESSLSF